MVPRYLLRIQRLLLLLCFFLPTLRLGLAAVSDQARLHHHASTTTASSAAAATSTGTTVARSFLLLCLTDGSIYSLSAWTGDYQSVVRTDPLLQTNSQRNDEKSKNVVLPGLDGRLYWRPDDDRPLQELPLTVTALLENPVRSCDDDSAAASGEEEEEKEECGILTAQAVTSLLALSDTGELLWKTKDDDAATSSNKQHSTKNHPSLLLQRKDYWVQHVLASTGQQSWNVSLGTYQALDFGVTPAPTSTTRTSASSGGGEHDFLLDDDGIHDNNGDDTTHTTNTVEDAPLPSVIFSNAGRTLTAVDPVTERALWRQDTPSTLAAVFGISHGQWKTVDVLQQQQDQQQQQQQQQDNRHDSHSDASQKELPAAAAAAATSAEDPQREYERFLWSQQWDGYQQRQQHPQNNNKELTGRQSIQQQQQSSIEEVCDGDDDDVSTCQRVQQLLLPSPPTVQKTAEGLLISWSVVTTIAVLIVAIAAAFRIWYVRKKQKWVSSSSVVSDSNNATTTTTNNKTSTVQWKDVSSMSSSSPHMHRSNSLPGTLGLLDPLATQNLPKSDEGLQSSNSNTASPSAAGAVEGSIPLVRYSRYASEFKEVTPLGKGGFGSVYLCTYNLDDRDYAVKKVSIRGASHDLFQQQLQRVLREVKILAVLDHPNIVRYYTAWLELVDGRDGDDGDTTTVQDTATMGISRHYSSSLLLNSDSVSGWGNSQHDSDSVSGWGHDRRDASHDRNPLHWDNDEASDGGLLMRAGGLPRRRSLRNVRASAGDLMIFDEGSNEDAEQSTGLPSKSGTVSRDNSVPVSRNRSFALGDEHQDNNTLGASSLPNTTVEEADIGVMRHTLYIQMQLCSHKTVAEFLANEEVRRGPSLESGVDIPKALRLFLQIAEAVKHVHSQGLIHRDLKPCNCFLDDSGSTVKVGDFGLSRESTNEDESTSVAPEIVPMGDDNDDHTAGVGTRSYASPEQMNGSDYDSSTDVFSLGIILFELLYPMYTGMERIICLTRLRDHIFPADWENAVGNAFPTVKGLLIGMLSRSPSDRPTAEFVARRIESILGEFTIMSLDKQQHDGPEMVFLRVEADHSGGDALRHTMQVIRDESTAADAPVDIVQYGLRSSSAGEKPAAIMEFALKYSSSSSSSSTKENGGHRHSTSLLVSKLVARPEIFKARQVSGASSSTQS